MDLPHNYSIGRACIQREGNRVKVIEERWEGIGWAIEQGEKQAMTPEGLPLMKPDGTPETEPITIMVFIHQRPDEAQVIRVPFDADAKAKLIQMLTGGVIVPVSAADMPRLH